MDDVANGADVERLDSLAKIDWNAVRTLGLVCLDAAQDLKSWADESVGGYYNEARAAQHLAAIKKAQEVSSQALTAFTSAGDTVFEQIAQASVGEGPRPDFGFTATAHESSLVLLVLTVRWVHIGLGDGLVSIGAREVYDGSIQDLHLCSPKQLRDALHQSEKSKSLQSLFDRFQPLIKIRAWINREWAAVSCIAAKLATGDGPKLRVKVHTETKVVEIDGKPYPLSGREESKARLVAFIQALIDAKGAAVSAKDHGIRTRDIEGQHDKIRSLIGDDAKAGSGHRIPLEKLLA